MTTTGRTSNETTIEASPEVPTITITREFDAPRALVWRAMTEPELVTRWLGPRDVTMTIEEWDCRTGGSYRYRAGRAGDPGDDALSTSFYGSFHEVREPSRAVQTFTWAGAPDGVSLETMTLEERPDGRTRFTGRTVVESFEIRDTILASGMEVGIKEGYEQLDTLLGELA